MIKERPVCSCCGKERRIEDYYSSQTYVNKHLNKISICKYCVWEYVITEDNGYDLDRMKDILQMIDKPFLTSLHEASEDEAKKVNKNTFKLYMKNLGLAQNRHLRWKDSDIAVKKSSSSLIENDADSSEIVQEIIVQKLIPNEFDKKNKDDVLKMLGYDPFATENESDKIPLYNRLVDFLDESTLEDSFKLPAVIEIVKTFNQIDKINSAISKLTSDVNRFADNVGNVNSLITAKEKMLKSVLALAKDNGISVNHNNNKSKGGNTLNGIVKKLNEIGLSSAELNLFDIETCESMKQIADFSNKSILEQLMLDENDYTDMIAQQKEMIHQLDSKLIKEEEENRLLKIELSKLKGEITPM